jgi:hypothetical protein
VSGASQPEIKLEELAGAQTRRNEIEDPTESSAAAIPWGILAVVLLTAAVGLAIWGSYTRESPPPQRTTARPALQVQAATAESKSKVNESNAAPSAISSEPIRTAAQDQAKSNSDTSSPPGGQPASLALSSTPIQPSASGSQVSAGAFVVLVRARQDSWITITADGKQMLHEILVTGSQKSLTAEKEIVIKAGNVGALDFSFNATKLPMQGDYGEVKTVTFNPNGLVSSSSASEQNPVSQ